MNPQIKNKTLTCCLVFILMFGSVSFVLPTSLPEAFGDVTGSISLDRTVYPVPFGVPDDFLTNTTTTPDGRSLFPIHQTGVNTAGTPRSLAGLQDGEFISSGDLFIHVRVNDIDFDSSPSVSDLIDVATSGTTNTGPVKIYIQRGADIIVLGYAGGPTSTNGLIDVGDNQGNSDNVRQFGPMLEVAPDSGIFEIDIPIRYTDGPASASCPVTDVFTSLSGSGNSESDRFDESSGGQNFCLLVDDEIIVEYTDPLDGSGGTTVTSDAASFDLRNGVLQSDKSVYGIDTIAILTIIDPDFDLDSDAQETIDLDVLEWNSAAAIISMGDAEDGLAAPFDPEPIDFRETGDSTGIFQIVIDIPSSLDGNTLAAGEEIILEYTDWGPSGSQYTGQLDEDVNITIFTSNFGATVELDQSVYTWTDKVFITVVAPDHNSDGDLIDEIGNSPSDPIRISTRSFDLDQYKLVETGTDTGIFSGEVILTGFLHDADGDVTTGDASGFDTTPTTSGSGPTDGLLESSEDDGITVSFEFAENETVVGSALILWNIGDVQWLETFYDPDGTGVVRVIDPDMNLNPEAVDSFDVLVWSDSDAGGIDLTVTETNEATGIFEGTVFFTTTEGSSGHILRVADADTVTAEYTDHTLPDEPITEDLDITATTLMSTLGPPTNLGANIGDQQVSLFWDAPTNTGGAINDYIIEFSIDDVFWDIFTDGLDTQTTATVESLDNGQPYFFRVSAVNPTVTGPVSSSIIATPSTFPDAPENIAVTPDDQFVDLTWDEPNNGGSPIIQYIITYTNTVTTIVNQVVIFAPDTFATINGLTNGDEYAFVITAENTIGVSFDSNVVFATPVQVVQNVTWDGGAGTVFWTDAQNWSNDQLPNPQDNITIDVTATNIDSLGLDFTLSGTLNVLGGGTVNQFFIRSDFVNNGVINIREDAVVRLFGSIGVLTNNGVINVEGYLSSQGGILINNANGVINTLLSNGQNVFLDFVTTASNAGTINNGIGNDFFLENSMTFVNTGDFNNSGTITVQTGATFDNDAGTITNDCTGTISGDITGNLAILSCIPNVPPVAYDDTVTTTENTSINIDVLADNGNGADSDGISIVEVQSGQFSSFGEYNSLVQLDFDTFVLANQGNNQNGFIKVYDILADGSFTEVNTLEHDTQNGAHNSLVQVDSNTFALAYQGGSLAGFIKNI